MGGMTGAPFKKGATGTQVLLHNNVIANFRDVEER